MRSAKLKVGDLELNYDLSGDVWILFKIEPTLFTWYVPARHYYHQRTAVDQEDDFYMGGGFMKYFRDGEELDLSK